MKSKTAAVVLSLCGVLFVFSSPLKADEGKNGTAGNLIEGFPAAYAVDGSLSEWTMPPSVTLTAANQVAGKDRAKGDKDFRSSVWVAVSTAGALIAGKVEDDAYLPAVLEKDIANSDHLELWLSFKEAEMPPIGFGNQFANWRLETKTGGEQCFVADTQGEDSPKLLSAEAVKWVDAQRAWRRVLAQAFSRHYSVSAMGVREEYWSKAAAAPVVSGITAMSSEIDKTGGTGTYPVFPSVADSLKQARTEFRKSATGYTFEAFIPAAAFPACSEAPLSSVKAFVTAVDSDRELSQQEKLFSSFPGAQTGSPKEWVALKKPLLFNTVYAFIRDNGTWAPSFFYFPGSVTPEVYAFVNYGRGYQYSPDAPSPEIVLLKKPLPALSEFRGIGVHEVPFEISADGRPHYKLVAVKDGKTLSAHEFQGSCRYGVYAAPKIIEEKGDTVRIRFERIDMSSMYGAGSGGSGMVTVCEEILLDKDGSMQTVDQGETPWE